MKFLLSETSPCIMFFSSAMAYSSYGCYTQQFIIQNSVEEIRRIGNSYLPVGGIYIPKSVKSISSGAMSAKEGIIYYEGSEEEWLNIIDPNDIYFSEDYFDITFNYVLE